jgi:nitrate reductase beta subunit
MLYDADAVLAAASIENDQDLLDAQRACFLDPFDPEVIAAAKAEGMADDWIEAAQNSPIYKLISEFEVALPLHPEYRTMPMVWYIPPLSPVVDVVSNSGNDGEDARTLFAAIDKLRIPVEYLAGLFSAGDVVPVELSLRKLAAMRAYMRDINLGNEPDERIPNAVGMTGESMQAMYRLLAIAKYEDRYVIPKAHVETARELDELGCSLDNDGGPGMGGPSSHPGPHNGGDAGPAGPYGNTPGMPLNATVDNYNQMVGDSPIIKTRPATPGRVNLLNWNGSGVPQGMFPPIADAGSPA